MSKKPIRTASRPHSDDSRPGRPQKSFEPAIINLRLVSITAIVVVIAIPILYLWRGYQVDRNATALIERATELSDEAEKLANEADDLRASLKIDGAQEKEQEAKKQWRLAASRIDNYLTIKPDDVDARLRMVDMLHKSASNVRTMLRVSDMYRVVIGLAPDDRNARQRYTELLLTLGRYRDALEQASHLLKAEPSDSVGLRARALATLGMADKDSIGQRSDIGKMFRRAVEENPNDIELSVRSAFIYRVQAKETGNSHLETLADEVIDKMVDHNGESEKAYLQRYYYRSRLGSAEADADLEQALALGPRNVAVLFAAGQRALAREEFDRASRYFSKLIDEDEFDFRGYLFLGAAYESSGESERAIETWQRGIEQVDPVQKLRLIVPLAERQISMARLDDAHESLVLAQALTEKRIPREPTKLRGKRRSTMAFLWARWHLARNEFSEAIPHLRKMLLSERMYVGDDRRIDELAITHGQLGQCYGALELWDVAAAEFEKASKFRPANARYAAGSAVAWERAGALRRAIPLLEAAVKFDDAPDEAWISLIRAHARRQAGRTKADRDWTMLDRLMIQAKERLPDSLELSLLECQVYVYKENIGEAVRVLEEIHQESPDDWPTTRALILTYTQASRSEEAESLLDEATKRNPDELGLLFLRAQLLLIRQEHEQARELLGAALKTLSGPRKRLVAGRLAEMHIEAGGSDDARLLLDELLVDFPDDMAALRLQCELANGSDQFDEAEKYEQRLRELEGRSGTWWRYFRARRLAMAAQRTDDPRLAEAFNLQTEIQSVRPSWPQAFELKGLIANRRDHLNEALDAYRTAIDLGDRRVRVFRSVIALLYRQNRFSEAAKYLRQLQDMGTGAQDLAAMAVALSMRQGEMERAVQLANEAVRQRPDDAAGHSWLGTVLMASGKRDLAEVEYRMAVEMAPDDIRTWTALLSFYAMSDENESARRILLDIETSSELAEPEKAFALAQGYEVVGEVEAAETHYGKAVELAGDNILVWRRAAQFFETRDTAKAEKCLRRALELEPDSNDTRSEMAAFLARRGGEENLKEAWELVGLDESENGSTSKNSALTASLLMQGGKSESRRQAQRMLEGIVQEDINADPQVHLFLARLYESDGLLQSARAQLRQLVDRPDRTADHLGAYVNMLLRHELSRSVGQWMEELEKVEPDTLRTAGLKTRWLAAEGRRGEIEPTVEKYAEQHVENNEDPKSAVSEMLRTARLYAGVEMHKQSERWFRRAVETEPRTYWALVGWLAKQGRISEAVDICLEKAKTDRTPGAAMVLSTVLSKHAAPEKSVALCEVVLAEALARHPRELGLLFSVATMRYLQDRNNEAIELYRRVIKSEPDHIMTLNNLASLLSEKPEFHAEALRHIDRAISLSGSTLALQDTKGMVLLAQGKFDKAVSMFRRTTLEPPVDPRFHFHLALAYQKAGSHDDARDSLAKAISGGVRTKTLSHYEMRELTTLELKLLQ